MDQQNSLGTSLRDLVVLLWFCCLFLVGVFRYSGFCNLLHVLLTCKRTSDRQGYGAKNNRSCRILEVSVASSRFVSLVFSSFFFWRAVKSDLRRSCFTGLPVALSVNCVVTYYVDGLDNPCRCTLVTVSCDAWVRRISSTQAPEWPLCL